MKFSLLINFTPDAEAVGGGRYDLAWAVSKVVHKIEDGETEGNVLDPNGNTIGSWEIAK